MSALHHEGIKAAERHLERIEESHKVIVRQLGLSVSLVDDTFGALRADLDKYSQMPFDKAYDAIVCHGELCSTRILYSVINEARADVEWLDARSVISTNGIHRDATVNWERTKSNIEQIVRPLLDKGVHVVLQGFIGGHNGDTTTLGREGSDYTAAIIAYCLDASEVTIWKDVPGILSGDPRDFDNVAKIDRLSYREAIEMTYYGAKVIKASHCMSGRSKTLHPREHSSPRMSKYHTLRLWLSRKNRHCCTFQRWISLLWRSTT